MPSPTQGFSSFHFSTRGLAPEQRLIGWRDALARVAQRELSPIDDRPFEVDMTVHALGLSDSDDRLAPRVCVVKMDVTEGGTGRRTRDLLSDGNDDVVLHIQQTGRRIVSQFGRERWWLRVAACFRPTAKQACS
jgi:hypothetical protein